MTSHTDLAEAADCVLAVQLAMHEAGLWHDHTPTPAAMASRTPFCADTLEFSQWLQFVFIPRMRHVIEAGGPLPRASGIAVMAEAKLATERAAEQQIVDVLTRFDQLIEKKTAR